MGVVAISGQAASGKTTIARMIAERLNYRFVSVGELFRKIAAERGVDLLRLHEIAERDYSIDRFVDQYAVEEARRGNVVIEGHLAAWMVKDYADVKIYLKADINTRARRLASRDGLTFDRALAEISAREASNRRRYLAIYGIDIGDLTPFDLVVDTTYIDAGQVFNIVYQYVVNVLRARGRL